MTSQIDIPGYEIIEKVGEGGMGSVWKARQLSLDRIVAIKILFLQSPRNEKTIERFHLEVKAAGRLKNSGIVQVYDAGEREGYAYCVMEYVEDSTVGEWIEKKGPFSTTHALTIAQGVATALAYAWEHASLIHCDIKPDNIMIDRDGTIKVADLGLAKIIGRASGDPDKDMITGTPNYISPEQAGGNPDLDCRTDMYALGSTLYHMLTGKMPFAECNEMEALDRQVNGRLDDPVDIRAEVSHPAVWLIEKLMAKDRNLRHRNWDEVLADIEAVLAGGMPRGEALADGASTLRRSASRKRPVQVKQKAPIKIVSSGAAPQKKVVLKPGAARGVPIIPEEPRNPLAGAIVQLIALAVVTAVLYVAAFLTIPVLRASRSGSVKHETAGTEAESSRYPHSMSPQDVQSELHAEESYRGDERDTEFTEEEDVAEPASKQTGPWKNPVFIEGAKAFNRALDNYKRCQSGELPKTAFKQVEEDFRYAIEKFNQVRNIAPEDVPIAEYTRQSYELISACRQLTLLGPEAMAAKESTTTIPDKPSAADAFMKFADAKIQESQGTSADEISASSVSTPFREVKGGLNLGLNWDASSTGAKRQIVADLQRVLAGATQARIELSPNPDHMIFEGVTYLMPAAEAARVSGGALPARNPVVNPGFPRGSFSYYSLSGDYGEEFDTLLLMTDKEDKVAGVQLVSLKSRPKPLLPHGFFNGSTKTYNFLQSRSVRGNQEKVGTRTMVKDGNVIVDCEMITSSDFTSLARTRLILPQAVADVISYRLNAK
ncbi:MAG: serine/threonine protein kinase [Verrucomicrobia bacterium]|nr:serine/threonine protein kinase [Verrucomicrobiota bacterium]